MIRAAAPAARTATWTLRWDTAAEPQPRLDGAEFARTPAGNLVFLDGYLFEGAADDYDLHGDTFVDRLRGGWAIVVWDPSRRRLLIGRDAMGMHGCYYRWDGRTLEAAPHIEALARRGRFNRPLLAEYVAFQLPRRAFTETFFDGVLRVPCAHTLSLRGGRLELKRYWDPLPPGFSWATGDELAQFPSRFDRAVARCLSVGADSIALSGGFDSVSIAVAAARQGRRLHAVSLRFVGTPCDEGETQTAVARALGMGQTLRTLSDALGGRDATGASLALSANTSSPVLSMWQALYSGLLDSAADRGLSRLLLGTGGDDFFNVHEAYGLDKLLSMDLRGLWRYYRSWQRTSPFSSLRVARVILWSGAVRPALGRLLHQLLPRHVSHRLRRHRAASRVPSWIGGDFRDELAGRGADAPSNLPCPSDPQYSAAMRRLPQSPLMALEFEQGWEWAAKHGLTPLYPYFDRDLAELALRMHPEHLIAGGWAKAPIRRFVAERLSGVAMRRKKVDFSEAVHREFRPGGSRAWRELGGPSRLASLGVVEGDALSPLVESYFAGRNDAWLRAWLVLSTEAWLRAHS